jgi:predicted nucleic acid-binding protein
MIRHLLPAALFLLGLTIVTWIGVGYVGTHALGVVVTLVIGICYLAGAVELYRYRQATASLTSALADTSAANRGLPAWLAALHPSLRPSVRQRIEGGRVALPAPALTPYLVGLLVLLGMLGTLLGMMATLRGTGLALESATDIDAIRGSLAAPVKGLGFAFGTSIAGVATSAVLGLLAALCRRERTDAVHRLDAEITTSLHTHSQAFQREESFRLLQQQAALMPDLVERLQAMVASIEQQNAAAGERLATHQQAFHARTEAAQAQWAASFEQTLKSGVDASARAVVAALQPSTEATLAGLARESATLQRTVGEAVQRQLDGLSAGFGAATTAATASWASVLEQQQQANTALTDEMQALAARLSGTFEQQSAALVENVASRLEANATALTERWDQVLARQDARHAGIAERNEQALVAASGGIERHAGELLQAMERSHAGLQQTLASQDEQRLAAWAERLAAMSTALRDDWERAGMRTAQLQQDICDALARSAQDITTQAQAHSTQTIAEISQLVQVASEAPRAAADVIAELRQKLSDSMVRDTALLEERNQLMETLQTLLDAVNHASTEQRGAIDALVATSADLLDRVGTRFTDHVEAETGKLGGIAAQVAAGATEVASLGDALGTAVQLFGQSNEELLVRLQGIEGALDRSLARSDDQLAYYVAQAREVIDLSLSAQRQITLDLQQLGGAQPAEAA